MATAFLPNSSAVNCSDAATGSLVEQALPDPLAKGVPRALVDARRLIPANLGKCRRPRINSSQVLAFSPSPWPLGDQEPSGYPRCNVVERRVFGRKNSLQPPRSGRFRGPDNWHVTCDSTWQAT